MALLEMASEVEIYFIANWTATDIETPDEILNTSAMTEYISLNFFPVTNEQIGFDGTTTGRKAHYGLSQVLCYNKNKKLAMKLADDIKLFFDGQELPEDIHVDIGIDHIAIDLQTFWECKVTFQVKQFS